MTLKKTSVVLVEDNIAYLSSISALLDQAAGIEIIGRYTSAHDAIKGIRKTQPKVALVDLGLSSGLSGIDVIRKVSKQNGIGRTECIVLTAFDEDDYLFPALQAGAVGYLIKDQASLSRIVKAVKEVVNGEAPMSGGIARRILDELNGRKNFKSDALTQRELEILDMLAKGNSTRKVAEKLNVCYETIRRHQKNVYRKLKVHSLVEALNKVV